MMASFLLLLFHILLVGSILTNAVIFHYQDWIKQWQSFEHKYRDLGYNFKDFMNITLKNQVICYI